LATAAAATTTKGSTATAAELAATAGTAAKG
jgi:hypothetical protein